MSGKSKHGRGKHLSKSKRGKGNRGYSAAAPVSEPASRPEVLTPSAGVPAPAAPAAPPAPVRYPYIFTELRRIAILSGIMLAILVVLALVLS